MRISASRALAASLALALLVATGAVPVMAAKAGKDKADKPGRGNAPLAQVDTLKGAQYRMAQSKMARDVSRIEDGRGDQMLADGTAASAPDWSDISAVYVASTTMPPKLLAKMARDYPPGVSGAFYGNQADWATDDRIVFLGVEMADTLPAGADGQQVEVGLGGDAATPLQAGARLDTRIGVERFSLSGLFSNGAFATGSTDVSGREPGGPIDYYNTEAGIFGFYDRRGATWYLVIPRASDTDTVAVTVRSSTQDGEVLDRLELPGGGNFIDLGDPARGWDKGEDLPLLKCRSLETFSVATGAPVSDPEATLIRYTAGMDRAADADVTAALLAPAIEAVGTVPVSVEAAGAEEAALTVDGELAVAPGSNAVSLTFEVPAGEWRFAPVDELVTPAGELIFDQASLTGGAGVRTGPGLDGLVAGDLSCVAAADDAVTGDDAATGGGAAAGDDADAGDDPAEGEPLPSADPSEGDS